MKKKYITIITFFILSVGYGQQTKVEDLQKKKLELTNKIGKLKDSLKNINLEIENIKSKEILSKISDSAFVAYVRKNAFIKKSPNVFSDIIIQQKERKKVFVLDYSNGYVGACTEEICGYINEIWFEENELLKSFIEIKTQEAKNLRILKIEQELKTEKTELAKQEKKYIKKYGKKVYKKLKEGYIWIGMTKEMAIISRGYPKDKNRSVGSWGTHEQWVYDDEYLYFENGYLKSWQD
tara:strand:- start:85 stop:795 length:711 start_codon:yes stop_codon:yes gene_type:complete